MKMQFGCRGPGPRVGRRMTAFAAGLAALLASGNPAFAQINILALLGINTSTLQQLGIISSTLQQLGVTNSGLQVGATNLTLQQQVAIGLSTLQLSLTQASTATTIAAVAGDAITTQINGVVADAFGRSSAFDSFAATAPGVYKARTKSVGERPWIVWLDGRGTGWENHGENSGLNGTQANVTGGIGRKLTPDLLVGAFADYAALKYNFAALETDTRGHGATVGTFLGWRMTPNIRFDASMSYARVSYSISTDSAAGSYDGNRWLVSSGVTGSYELNAFVLEPSANVYALWERQDGWTDTVGSLHPDRRFSAGRVSTGARLIRPWTVGDLKMTPYAGVFGDWRFSSGDALPTGQPVVGIGDGWSARVTSGIAFTNAGPLVVSLGGEYGGIGADYKVWTGNLRGTVQF